MKEINIEDFLNKLDEPLSDEIVEISSSEENESLKSFKDSIRKFNENQESKLN